MVPRAGQMNLAIKVDPDRGVRTDLGLMRKTSRLEVGNRYSYLGF